MKEIEQKIGKSTKNFLEEGDKLQKEARKRVVTYITAAFGLVAGLAWNDAIKSLIEYWFPVNQGSVTAKFVYALLVTAILVVVTMYLVRLFKDKKE